MTNIKTESLLKGNGITRGLTLGKNSIFDIEKFMEVQYKIYKKFIPPTHSDTSLEKFDKLLINLSEEMVEYLDELEINSKEKIDELVDVIMYTGTCIAVWKDEYPNEYKLALETCRQEYKAEDYEVSMSQTFAKQFYENIRIRRNFSERKWHKPHNPEEIKEPIVYRIILLNLKYLNVYINQLFYYDHFMETAIRRIEMKQSFIFNL